MYKIVSVKSRVQAKVMGSWLENASDIDVFGATTTNIQQIHDSRKQKNIE